MNVIKERRKLWIFNLQSVTKSWEIDGIMINLVKKMISEIKIGNVKICRKQKSKWLLQKGEGALSGLLVLLFLTKPCFKFTLNTKQLPVDNY